MWISAAPGQTASAGGGGGADFPFDSTLAKTRRFRVSTTKIIPAGAFVVDILNTGIGDATITVAGGAAELLGPGLRYNFSAQQNTIDQTMEISKSITITPSAGDQLEVFVAYPASSVTDPNSI